VYFGYTFCPDVCPATLVDLKNAIEALGEEAAQVQVIFISVDPERDSPQRAMDYARAFNPGFIGLTGSVDEVAAAASPFGVYFEKDFSGSAAGYLMNHTSVVTGVDRDGNVRVLWPLGVKSDDIAADLRQLLR
jgi:protein SCO1/2